MSDLVIAEGTMVTLHFSVALTNGNVVDTTFDGEPAVFTVGDGNLLAGFESSVFGLAAGAKEAFVIAPEEGFGQHNPSNIQVIARDQFSDDIDLEEGLVLSFADAQNTELPGVVSDVSDKDVTVDFNHPLAGKEIVFTVEIIKVEPTTTH